MEFPNTDRVIEEFATTIQQDWRNLLEEKGYDMSPLKYINFTVKNDNQIYIIKFSVADYFWYFDRGRRAGKRPPLEPIFRWIQKYNIIPKPLTLKNGKTVIPSQKSLAFLIQRSIGLKGTKGKFWWEPMLNDIIERYMTRIQEAIVDDLSGNIEDELKDIPDVLE